MSYQHNHHKNSMRKEEMTISEIIKSISLSELHSFPDNPFHVTEDAELEALTESVREFGVICPLVVRPHEDGGYEIISGHRRRLACERAGLEQIPAFVRDMDRDTAVIAIVDSNLQREHILPSERAFAYKMKIEAIKHQGRATSPQVAAKLRSDDSIASSSGISGDTIQRYIRLTNLIPEILTMVDEGKIAFTPAVELSYLTEDEQRDLLDAMDDEERTPSLSQAQRMKKLSQSGQLGTEAIAAIISEEKPNQIEKLRLPAERVRSFFPKDSTPQQMEDVIFKLLAEWRQRQERKRNNGAR